MKKKFDAVAFQRKVRDKISKKVSKNPKSLMETLHERFGHASPTKTRSK